MPMITTESCASNNVEPNITTGTLIHATDLSYINLNITFSTNPTFTFRRNLS